MSTELERRIKIAEDAVHAAFIQGSHELFISGSTAINGVVSTDVDVVVYTDDFDYPINSWACSCLAVSGWGVPTAEYPVGLWISFKKTVDDVIVNILLCESRTVYDQAAAALAACKRLAATGVVDKQRRVDIHRAIMGDA